MQPDNAAAPGSNTRKGRSFVTDRPVAVSMVFIAAIVFGYFSLTSLPVTLMPELSYPTITVRTEYPGAAPEEVENDISRPLEEALGIVGGLKEISSISRAGVSDVVLQFVWGIDISEATQDALERLDRVRLPREAERPLLLHFDPSLDPVMELSFSGRGKRYQGEEGLRRLRRISELQIKRFLEPIPGIAAVRLRGGLEEEIHVLLDENKLKRSDLNIKTIISRLSQENINVAGGTVQEGGSEYLVRTLNEFKDLEQIRKTIVTHIDDHPLRIEDIGEVKLAFKEREILTSTDGNESVQIDIYKEADANMVELAKRVRYLIGEIPQRGQRAGNRQNARGGGEARGSEARAGRGGGGGGRGGRGRGGPSGFSQLLSKLSGEPVQNFRGLAAHLQQSEGASLKVVSDRSTFIESSISEVKQTAMLGGLLAIFILYVFLRNFKSTAIIAVSIPVSILITFAPMHLSGITLNIMSLGGLALGIGMLVDSSIVVLESIYRCREEGDSMKAAAIRGVGEVRGAVFASVLTSIAVFFPMVFVEGIAGQAFSDLGIAVVVSLVASFLVAITLIPMLATRKGLSIQAAKEASAEEKGFKVWLSRNFASLYTMFSQIKAMPLLAKLVLLPIAYVIFRALILLLLELVGLAIRTVFAVLGFVYRRCARLIGYLLKILLFIPLQIFQSGLAGAHRIYIPILRWAISHTQAVGMFVLACFAAIYWFATSVETELLPEVYQGEFTIEVQLPVGTPLAETHRVLRGVESSILEQESEIENLLVTYGYDVTNAQSADEGEHSAKFKVILKKGVDLKATELETTERLRQFFVDIPDAELRVVRPVLFSETTPLEIEVYGTDLEYLKQKTLAVKLELESLPELADVESSLRKGAPEIQVHYDRNKIIKYGLNIGEVAEQVRDMVRGAEATRFNKVDRRIPIVVRLEEDDRLAIESIRKLIINPRGQQPIPLYAVAELEVGEGPSEIRRVDGNRVGLINANLGEASLSGAAEKITETLNANLSWDDGTSFSVTGQSEEWDQSKGSLMLALALSVFLVYVIMAAQFESLMHPLIIMFSIPLAFLGTFAGLFILQVNLSIVVVLGMIMLTGLVVNNAIVFVDYINNLRSKGMALEQAVLQAGSVRLRPILMTTATTILGLLPMAVGLGDGAEIRTPMAIAVITGLLSSTILTLLIIPAIYYSVEQLKLRFFGEPVNELDASEGET